MGIKAADSVVIRNIFYMLAYATGTSGSDARSTLASNMRDIETEDFSNYINVLGIILVDAINTQRLRGFNREYRSVTERLGYIKGRIDLPQTLVSRSRGSMSSVCTYDMLTEDTYMNRILRATGEYLLRISGLDPQLRKRLKNALLYLSDVGEQNPITIEWNRLRYNQLNQSYRFLMSVCRMILEGKIAVDKAGADERYPDLFSEQRLSSLFEHFVLEYFSKHHKRLKPAAPYVDYGIEESNDLLPRLHTDITLTGKNSSLVIDTKCYGKILKTNCERDILAPAHRNQILSYVLHLGAKRKNVSGMLLYAQTTLDYPLDIRWRELGHTFMARSIDLGVDFSSIAAQLDAIAMEFDSDQDAGAGH